MCPVCIATAAVIVGSATGTGGITAFVTAKILRKKSPSTENQEVNHGNSNGN
jgi:hypothetical protein